MLKLLQYVVCEDRQDKYNKESVKKIFLIVKKIELLNTLNI